MNRTHPHTRRVFLIEGIETNNNNGKKTKIRENACTLLEKTLVTGIPGIVRAKNCFRRLAKLLILLCCFIGFIYQSYLYLTVYFQLSTTVRVSKLGKMKIPALTICDENRISRFYLCENKVLPCRMELLQLVQQTYPDFCLDKEHIYNVLPSNYEITRKEYSERSFIKKAGFQIQESLLLCQWHCKNIFKNLEEYTISNCSSPTFTLGITRQKLAAACYIFKPSTGDSDYQFEYLNKGSRLEMVLKWEPKDTTMYADTGVRQNKRAYWLSFHSPDDKSNPFFEGIRVEEGYPHLIQVSQVETTRLPSPYPSKCFDYISAWKKNGNQGPLTKEACLQQCNIQGQSKVYGCVSPGITYPHNLTLCYDTLPFDKDLDEWIGICQQKCGESCRETKYKAEVTLYSKMNLEDNLKTYRSPSAVLLDIYFNSETSVIHSEVPILTTEDLLSDLGGYMSLWLGWSTLVLLDLLEISIRILLCPLKLMKK